MKFLSKETIALLLFLTAVLLFCFYDVVFLNKTFKVATLNPQILPSGVYGQETNKIDFFPVHSTTTSFMEEPIFQFVKDSLVKNHEFPFWNPYQGCGYPLIAMMHHGFFWPLHLIYYLLPNSISWDLVILLRLLLGGVLMYWFLKKIELDPMACAFGAAVFMLSPGLTLYQYGFMNVIIVLPLLLLLIERLLERPGRLSMTGVGIGVWLTFLAGHPEHIVLINGFAVLYFLFRFFSNLSFRQKPGLLLWLAAAYALGLALSAALFLPFLQDWIISFWHCHPDYDFSRMMLAPDAGLVQGLSFLFPFLLQDVPVSINFTRPALWGYLGIVPASMGLTALLNTHKQRLALFFFASAVFLFCKAHLVHPLVNWVEYLPLLRHIRFDFHGIHLFGFLTAVLAASGFDYVLKTKRTWPLFLIFAVLLSLAGIAALKYFRHDPQGPGSYTAVILGVCLGTLVFLIVLLRSRFPHRAQWFGAALILLFLVEIFSYLPHKRPVRFDSFPRVPAIEFLRTQDPYARVYGVFWALYPNTATGYQISDFGMNYGLLMNSYVQFLNNTASEPLFKKDYSRSAFSVIPLSLQETSRFFFNIAGVKYTIAPAFLDKLYTPEQPLKDFYPVYDHEVKIFKDNRSLSRAYIVHRALVSHQSDDATILTTFGSFDPDPKGIILSHEIPDEMFRSVMSSPIQDDSSATITALSANHVEISATMRHPGFLVLLDLYHPDWTVSIDGKKGTVYQANYLFRAVYLPEGTHAVSFRYRPTAFYIGLVISLLTGLGLAALCLGERRSKSARS